MNRMTYCKQYFMSVQRLSLIYLVKELSGCQNQNEVHNTMHFVLVPMMRCRGPKPAIQNVEPRRITCAAGFTTNSDAVLVGLGRFELPTSPLSGVRSNQLSYRPKNISECLVALRAKLF